jgi:hypothetical protein
MSSKRRGPKQVWAIGATVKLGGRQYLVVGMEPPRAKGEGPCWVLDTLDHTKTYTYVAFRGLQLIRGDLVRPARAARRKAAYAAARAAKAQERAAAAGAHIAAQPAPVAPPAERVGFLRGLLARLKPGVKPQDLPQHGAAPEAPRRAIAGRSRG